MGFDIGNHTGGIDTPRRERRFCACLSDNTTVDNSHVCGLLIISPLLALQAVRDLLLHIEQWH